MARILVWSPNYAPEPTGIPPLVTDAAEWLAAGGHRVDVVTGLPNYPERRVHREYAGALWRSERRGEVAVHRSWLRVRPRESFRDKALYEASFSAFSLPNVLARAVRSDVVLCVVPTLTAALCAAGIARVLAGRLRLVLWVQDLVLEAAHSVEGIGAVARRAIAAARVVERLAVRGADGVLVCSPGFRDHLVARGARPDRIETILNWADLARIAPTPVAPNGGPARFLYAGNVGYTQGLETVVDAARLAGPRLAVDIVGAGNASEHVGRLAARVSNVTVAPPVPAEEFPGLLAGASAHLVVQRRVSAGANLPSKIATYMASGRPLVGSICGSTSAAALMRESGGAVLVEPESPAQLADAMRMLADRPRWREELGARARAFALRRFGREAALARLEAAVLG